MWQEVIAWCLLAAGVATAAWKIWGWVAPDGHSPPWGEPPRARNGLARDWKKIERPEDLPLEPLFPAGSSRGAQLIGASCDPLAWPPKNVRRGDAPARYAGGDAAKKLGVPTPSQLGYPEPMQQAFDVETLARALHEAGREAVEKGLTVGRGPAPFVGWDEISEAAREGRRVQARWLLRRFRFEVRPGIDLDLGATWRSA